MLKIIEGDCLRKLPLLPPASIDMVCADLPYGMTRNTWDCIIPIEPMWRELHRVVKRNAAIVLMAAQPFASQLVCSNPDEFRYDIIWSKNKATGFLNANRQPLRAHEHILVFYRAQPHYNPQKTVGHAPLHGATRTNVGSNYNAAGASVTQSGSTMRYPTSVWDIPIINNDSPDKAHPTQKPVELMRRLVLSYTRPGALVLDPAAGSGTTGVACVQCDRNFIGIESNPAFAALAKQRIKTAKER